MFMMISEGPLKAAGPANHEPLRDQVVHPRKDLSGRYGGFHSHGGTVSHHPF